MLIRFKEALLSVLLQSIRFILSLLSIRFVRQFFNRKVPGV